MLDEMSGVQSEGRGWPVEVMVAVMEGGEVAILNRYGVEYITCSQVTQYFLLCALID